MSYCNVIHRHVRTRATLTSVYVRALTYAVYLCFDGQLRLRLRFTALLAMICEMTT